MITDNDLIENAILAFLHHYPEHHLATAYGDLLTRVRALKNEQPENPPNKKRGRPAQRQRTQKTTGSETSEETSQTIKT